ncbi:MAG: two-component sensor histidine kinase [Mucilaginibacter sp.]|nr:two-component sensor histidine kinase [Mucilaginibacter sp.]
MSFREKVIALWTRITGKPSAFQLEFRIFHSVCLTTILALSYSVCFTLSINLYVPALICTLVCIIFLYLYYRSRFKGKMHHSILLWAILINVLSIINYFFNSGIKGPADFFIGLTILLVIAITPRKQHAIWLSISITSVLVLHAIEYYYPALVPDAYLSRTTYFFDKTSACLVVIIMVYFTTKYIRRNYSYEKRQAEEKTQAIKEQNQFILSQNEQLAQINSEKNKLLSIIAHDLRAPLSNIQNYLELVTEYGLNKKEREVVEVDLLDITRNTLGMLSKLLVWSKSQMEGVRVKLGDVNLYAVLINTLELERILALKKGIILSYLIDPLIIVVADSDMLQLVVRNLVSNAIKFTQVGGVIDISTEMVLNEYKICVRDNGHGIAFDQQPDIFSLRAKSTFGTSNEKGVGLGLLLCKEFTEQQGGRIGFESTPGKGSTFFIYMPTG